MVAQTFVNSTKDFTLSQPTGALSGPYSGPPDPLLERLVDRRYSTHRSRLLDRWLVYADLEGFTAGEVAR